MNRSRLAAAVAAVALLLATLTGCPVQADDDDDEGGEEDYITFVLAE